MIREPEGSRFQTVSEVSRWFTLLKICGDVKHARAVQSWSADTCEALSGKGL